MQTPAGQRFALPAPGASSRTASPEASSHASLWGAAQPAPPLEWFSVRSFSHFSPARSCLGQNGSPPEGGSCPAVRLGGWRRSSAPPVPRFHRASHPGILGTGRGGEAGREGAAENDSRAPRALRHRGRRGGAAAGAWRIWVAGGLGFFLIPPPGGEEAASPPRFSPPRSALAAAHCAARCGPARTERPRERGHCSQRNTVSAAGPGLSLDLSLFLSLLGRRPRS